MASIRSHSSAEKKSTPLKVIFVIPIRNTYSTDLTTSFEQIDLSLLRNALFPSEIIGKIRVQSPL